MSLFDVDNGGKIVAQLISTGKNSKLEFNTKTSKQ